VIQPRFCDDDRTSLANDPSDEVNGHSPAHDSAAEKALLGSILVAGQSGGKILSELSLRADQFYADVHQQIFGLMLEMHAAGKPVDRITLRHELLERGLLEEVGGEHYLHVELIGAVNHAGHWAYYADMVRDLAARRALDFGLHRLAMQSRLPSKSLDELQAGLENLRQLAVPRESNRKFQWLTAAQLDAMELVQRYLVPGVVVEGQPGGIYGSFKSLKTSLAMDLAVSVSTGSMFLGHFPTQQAPVAIMSGESGLRNLRSIARRVCVSRGWSFGSVENFYIEPLLPKLDDPLALREIEAFIREKGIKLLIIDPAYLALPIGEEAGNLFLVGQFLKPIGDICQATGCTILVVHHNKRGVPDRAAPAELSDIAWSGFAEFSAQWILLSRRSAFDAETGRHELWMNVGGRDGHCGLYGVEVDEGTQASDGGRIWEVQVKPASKTRAESIVAKESEKQQRKLAAQQTTEETHINSVWQAALRHKDHGNTARQLRLESKLNPEKFVPAMSALVDAGWVIKTQKPISGQSRDWFTPSPEHAEHAEQFRLVPPGGACGMEHTPYRGCSSSTPHANTHPDQELGCSTPRRVHPHLEVVSATDDHDDLDAAFWSGGGN
jgi:AAA domain/DnaB-like helicase N terminal domain